MRTTPLSSTDGFVLYDLDGADRSVGVARLAPKVLHDSAELLARSVTYLFATFELQISGASAGINAKPDGRDDAVAGFRNDVAAEVEAGRLALYPSTGLTDDDLAPLASPPLDVELTARSALAAVQVALGKDELRATTVGAGPLVDAAAAAVTAGGGTVDDQGQGLAADLDVVFVAGKAGVVDDAGAATMRAQAVVGLTPVPVSAKAYAVLRRRGVVYVPDFVALGAPYLAVFDGNGNGAAALDRVRGVMEELRPGGPDAWTTGAKRAETFLSTWQDALPFGRPLA